MRFVACRRALAPAALCVVVAGLAGCGGGGSSTAAGPTTTTDAIQARCTVYRQMANDDFSVASRAASAATDWPEFRAVLVQGNRDAESGYARVARIATGPLRADALRLVAFMPVSRALVARSESFARYRADVLRLPGDTAVRAAAKRVYLDAQRTCSVTIAHPLATAKA
jgi:hypothetical protein